MERARRGGKKGVRGDEWLRGGGSRAETTSGETASASGRASTCMNENLDPSMEMKVEMEGPMWLRRTEGDELEGIGEEGSTAQV